MQPSLNSPDLWRDRFPWPTPVQHKYDRGHALVLGGAAHQTGASKLAAYAALRSGAGLVSIACEQTSLPFYAPALQAVMTKPYETLADFAQRLKDPHITAVLLGPGAGCHASTKTCVLETLAAAKPSVLDADALRVFSSGPAELFSAIQAPCILTPHAGEFAALFGSSPRDEKERLQQATSAAKASGAVVILKGYHTIIAAPDGQIVCNTNATPFLATAGSGDVLGGIALGLLAQGMPAFEAGCAAVWLHAEAGSRFGPGLIAEDIAPALPAILKELYEATGLDA